MRVEDIILGQAATYIYVELKKSKLMSEKINEENKSIWNTNANYWNERMGLEGNDYHLKLVAPTTIELFLNCKNE